MLFGVLLLVITLWWVACGGCACGLGVSWGGGVGGGALLVVSDWWCGFDAVGCWVVLRCLNCVVWL